MQLLLIQSFLKGVVGKGIWLRNTFYFIFSLLKHKEVNSNKEYLGVCTTMQTRRAGVATELH